MWVIKLLSQEMSEIVYLEYYDDSALDDLIVEEVDFEDSEQVMSLLLLFGNGCVEQARVSAASPKGLDLFIAMINKGGYFISHDPPPNAKLAIDGCACFPEDSPFIFVDPLTKSGERCELKDFHSKSELEQVTRKRWWQIWRTGITRRGCQQACPLRLEI